MPFGFSGASSTGAIVISLIGKITMRWGPPLTNHELYGFRSEACSPGWGAQR